MASRRDTEVDEFERINELQIKCLIVYRLPSVNHPSYVMNRYFYYLKLTLHYSLLGNHRQECG